MEHPVLPKWIDQCQCQNCSTGAYLSVVGSRGRPIYCCLSIEYLRSDYTQCTILRRLSNAALFQPCSLSRTGSSPPSSLWAVKYTPAAPALWLRQTCGAFAANF